MKRFLMWTSIPGMLMAALLEQWLGEAGILVALVLLFLLFLFWIRIVDKQ
jgi:sensor histidine kinase YesM